MSRPTPNAELAYRTLDQIDASPEHWRQSSWVCGTSYCFGGWAVVLSGGQLNEDGEVCAELHAKCVKHGEHWLTITRALHITAPLPVSSFSTDAPECLAELRQYGDFSATALLSRRPAGDPS